MIALRVYDVKVGLLSALCLTLIAGNSLALPSFARANSASLDYSIEQLYKRAKQEKVVTIYSVTSRIYHIEEAFEKRYPGVDLIPFVLSSREQITRFKAERRAKLAGVDVLYFNDAPAALELIDKPGGLISYVPDRLHNKIPRQFQVPLLYHRLSTKVLLYNAQRHPTSPISNLWELTLPKWRGRVLMVDPASRQDYLDLLVSFIVHSDEMAAAYTDLFSEPPQLSANVKSVGEKFIRALFNNDLVLVASTERLNTAIGVPNQDQSTVGFGTYSDIRLNRQRGWALQASKGTVPAPGIIYPVVLAINRSSGHMSAAKLLVDFMLGDDSSTGGPALKPFLQAGEYLTRSDIVNATSTLTLDQLDAWVAAPEQVIRLRDQVFDLVLELSSQ